MSAGTFRVTKYQASYDPNRIHPIRLQPESYASGETNAISVNTVPNPAVTEQISAFVSMSTRGVGLRPRLVRLKLAPGATPPTGYSAQSSPLIPILSLSVWNSTTFNRSATVSYLGVNWTVVSRLPEIVR